MIRKSVFLQQNINNENVYNLMSNIYFPDQEITFNDLYFVCYMIERVARAIKQRNRYIIEHLGVAGLERQLSIAETTHCLNPIEVVSQWIDDYKLEKGDFDITNIDSKFTDYVPTDLQMGKVYARLVSSISTDKDYVDGISKVYNSPICDVIDNYNSSAFYEPSYVQTRAFYNGSF